ncbi:hypothetical protein P3L51_32105 [Streptomyces sp. PSRA5]
MDAELAAPERPTAATADPDATHAMPPEAAEAVAELVPAFTRTGTPAS